MTTQVTEEQTQSNSESAEGSLLVFSVAGRIGSGATIVANKLRDELYAYKYDVVMIDVSMLIRLSTLERIEELDGSDESSDQLVTEIDSRFESQYRASIISRAGCRSLAFFVISLCMCVSLDNPGSHRFSAA